MSSNRDKLRRQVFERDGGACQFCMRRRATDIHEIEQRSHHSTRLQSEVTFVLSNMISLCRECHERIGNTLFGEEALRVLLEMRFGYASNTKEIRHNDTESHGKNQE